MIRHVKNGCENAKTTCGDKACSAQFLEALSTSSPRDCTFGISSKFLIGASVAQQFFVTFPLQDSLPFCLNPSMTVMTKKDDCALGIPVSSAGIPIFRHS